MNRPVMIYLAGPMDDVTKTQARDWREQMSTIAPVGVAFYSPAHAYINASAGNFSKVDRANRIAISHMCDGMLAKLDGVGRGFGTIREIEFARMNNKPVAVVGRLDSLMQADLLMVDTLERGLVALLEAIQDDRDMPHPLAQLFGIGGHDEEA